MKPGTTEQLQRKRLIILTVGIGLLLLTAAVAMPWANRLWWGGFPKLGDVERRLNVWRLAERPGVLRGRRLQEIPFTRDASKSRTCFSLWRDRAGRIVAFSGLYRDMSKGEWESEKAWDWYFEHVRIEEVAASNVLHGLMAAFIKCRDFEQIARQPIRRQDPESGLWGRREYNGFEIEVETTGYSTWGDGPDLRSVWVIVKGRGW